MAAATLGGTYAFVSFGDPESIPTREELLDNLRTQALAAEGSYLTTLGGTVLFTAAQEMLARVLDARQVRHGAQAADNRFYDEQLESHPLWTAVMDNGLKPVIEEAIFRLVPAALFTQPGKMSWGVGLASNSLFGAIHNFGLDDDGNLTFAYKSLPILQFLLGAYCWYLMKARGFTHAAAAHVAYNSLLHLLEIVEDRRARANERANEDAPEEADEEADEEGAGE